MSNLLWTVTGTDMGAYADNALTLGEVSILDGLKSAYRNFLRVFLARRYGLIPTRASHYMHVLSIGLSALEVLLYLCCKQERGKKLLLLLLLALLPLGINCLYLVVKETSMHTLVLMSFVSVYILVAILIEYGQHQALAKKIFNKVHGLLLDAVIAGLAVIIMINIYTANEASLNMQLSYENTSFFANSVLTQLQSTPGYTTDSKVVLVGTYRRPPYYGQFSNLSGLMGVQGIAPGGGAIRSFFSYYAGVPLNWATQAEYDLLIQTDQVAQMPSYPNAGYVSQVEDIFVIKLSPLS